MNFNTTRLVKRVAKGFVCLFLAFILLHLIHFLGVFGRRYYTWIWTACPGSSIFDPSCTVHRALIAQQLQVVVKTGGSEPQSRLRSQLATVLATVPEQNIIVFSDMEEEVGGHRVHDAYAGVTQRERASYPEFALYDAQQEYRKSGKDTRKLEGGWDLAKYMNLAMKRQIWSMQQEVGTEHREWPKWYIFIDTDTFVDWDNLLGLLEHLDPVEKIYAGSPVWLPNLQFAHGGSAYVLSHAALKALNSPSRSSEDATLYNQYGVNTTSLCCGDEALARALSSKDIKLKGYWPMFNGEVPETIAFGRDLWCEPVLSLHHVSGEDMVNLWQWVEDWKARTSNKHPLLFRDLFHYVAPRLTDTLLDWDNSQEDMKIYSKNRASHTSVGHCRSACEADRSCFQYVYDGKACALSHHIRVGRKRMPAQNEARRFESGWMMKRIKAWTAENGCESAHWVASNP